MYFMCYYSLWVISCGSFIKLVPGKFSILVSSNERVIVKLAGWGSIYDIVAMMDSKNMSWLLLLINLSCHGSWTPFYDDKTAYWESSAYTLCYYSNTLAIIIINGVSTVGETPVFGWRTDPVLRSACSQLSLSSFRGR